MHNADFLLRILKAVFLLLHKADILLHKAGINSSNYYIHIDRYGSKRREPQGSGLGFGVNRGRSVISSHIRSKN